MKTAVLITGLLVLLVANFVMMYYAPYGLSPMEGFQGEMRREEERSGTAALPMAGASAMPPASSMATSSMPPMPTASSMPPAPPMPPASSMPTASPMPPMPPASSMPTASPMPPAPPAGAASSMPTAEGFASYFLESAGGAKDMYQAIGAYDGVKLSTGNNVSGWRYTAPNEPLMGAEFTPGPDSLFIFKNNQCKPECCGASFSCGGGCVCTSPQQRQYIAGRGGNRTAPEDSA